MSLNSNIQTDLLLLDFSKAFDKVSHSRLDENFALYVQVSPALIMHHIQVNTLLYYCEEISVQSPGINIVQIHAYIV